MVFFLFSLATREKGDEKYVLHQRLARVTRQLAVRLQSQVLAELNCATAPAAEWPLTPPSIPCLQQLFGQDCGSCCTQGVGNPIFLRLTARTPFLVSGEMLLCFPSWKLLDPPEVLVSEQTPGLTPAVASIVSFFPALPAVHGDHRSGVVIKLLLKSSMLIVLQLNEFRVIPLKSVWMNDTGAVLRNFLPLDPLLNAGTSLSLPVWSRGARYSPEVDYFFCFVLLLLLGAVTRACLYNSR